MSHPIVVGGTDQSLIMVAIDTSDNSFKTDLVAADITSLHVDKPLVAAAEVTPADKINEAPHFDSGIWSDTDSPFYIVDIADSVFSAYAPSVHLHGTWEDSGAGTSGLLIGLVHPMTVNSPNTSLSVASVTTAIKAKTDNLPASPAAVGSPMTLEASANSAIADAVLDEAMSGHETNGTLGKTVSDILVDTGTDGVVVAAASKTGYALSESGIDAILDEAITEPSGMFAWGSATLRNIIGVLGALLRNKVTSDSNSVDVRNDDDDATLWSYATSDDDTTFTSGEGT